MNQQERKGCTRTADVSSRRCGVLEEMDGWV